MFAFKLEKVFFKALQKNEPIEYVFHFAGLKSVAESAMYPTKYWDNNVLGTINLLKVMNKNNCKNLIFSSSATIYQAVKNIKIKENFHISPINTYGETKSTIEKILESNMLIKSSH